MFRKVSDSLSSHFIKTSTVSSLSTSVIMAWKYFHRETKQNAGPLLRSWKVPTGKIAQKLKLGWENSRRYGQNWVTWTEDACNVTQGTNNICGGVCWNDVGVSGWNSSRRTKDVERRAGEEAEILTLSCLVFPRARPYATPVWRHDSLTAASSPGIVVSQLRSRKYAKVVSSTCCQVRHSRCASTRNPACTTQPL